MKSVGVRELKSRLSQYLRLVKEGEIVIITEHNKVIAEIRRPISDINESNDKINKFLDKQEKEGKIIRSERSKSIISKILKEDEDKINLDWQSIYIDSREDRL